MEILKTEIHHENLRTESQNGNPENRTKKTIQRTKCRKGNPYKMIRKRKFLEYDEIIWRILRAGFLNKNLESRIPKWRSREYDFETEIPKTGIRNENLRIMFRNGNPENRIRKFNFWEQVFKTEILRIGFRNRNPGNMKTWERNSETVILRTRFWNENPKRRSPEKDIETYMLRIGSQNGNPESRIPKWKFW